jgi:hypothetical protein
MEITSFGLGLDGMEFVAVRNISYKKKKKGINFG